LYALQLSKLGFEQTQAIDILSFFYWLKNINKHDIPQPHWYLFMLGVSPLPVTDEDW